MRGAGRLASAALVVLSLSWLPAVWADVGGVGPKPDVRLLIDISGSMKESDPENLRAPALDLIVRLLPDGARAGVWIFGETVEQIVEHRVVDASWREEARRAVATIDNSGRLTNIPAALEAATYDLASLDPNYRVSIVLLTDGKVDVSDSPMINASASRSLLTKTAESLGATGVPVHTIALSDEADWKFLRSLAKATDGIAEKAVSAEELTSIYLQSVEVVAPTATVPVSGKAFQIDASVEEFTALIYFEKGLNKVGLVSPSDVKYGPEIQQGGVEWFRNDKFALVTVVSPEAGRWRMRAPGNARTRVTVISDLEFEVDPLPNNMPAGRQSELGLRLRERGEVISDPEVLGLFSVQVAIEDPRGERRVIDVSADYPAPADGEYRVAIPGFEQPGRFRLVASLIGQTLQRELRMYVEVAPTPSTSSITTRGAELPPADFRRPAQGLAAAVALVGALTFLILRRRRQRRLELWKRRTRETAANDGEAVLLSGLSADSEERRKTP